MLLPDTVGTRMKSVAHGYAPLMVRLRRARCSRQTRAVTGMRHSLKVPVHWHADLLHNLARRRQGSNNHFRLRVKPKQQ